MKIRTVKIVEVQDWDKLVENTYGKPYSFQQQDDCKRRGIFNFTVPNIADDYENDTVPEEVNHEEMGVSFAAWLARDPDLPLEHGENDWDLRLWWDRNFYPTTESVANDLHAKGLLDAGDYTINIDW